MADRCHKYDPTKKQQQLAATGCQKCGSKNLYHDYDPYHKHNGVTCVACGYEQKETGGTDAR